MFMTEQKKEDFKSLIHHAGSMLNRSSDELRKTFATHPLCLIEYIRDEKHNHIIEIRFDTEGAVIACQLDDRKECTDVYLALDNRNDEDAFIEYLTETADYDFRTTLWIVSGCGVKIKQTEDSTFFYFLK